MPLTNGYGSGFRIRILLFSSLTFNTPTKNFLNKFFCLLLFEDTCTRTSFFIDKKSKVTKQERINIFLLFLQDDRRIQEAQKHTDPDSDPLHCLPFTIVILWQQVGFQWCGHGHSSARLRRARGSQLTGTFGQAVQPELKFSQCFSFKSHLAKSQVENYCSKTDILDVPRMSVFRHFHLRWQFLSGFTRFVLRICLISSAHMPAF